MPQLLKRIAFGVGSTIAERTCTFSSVSNKGYYISLRPFVDVKENEKEFPLEWAFCGKPSNVTVKQVDEKLITQDFNFWLDTNDYLKVKDTHQGEVNTKWEIWDTGTLKESGTVYPLGKEKPGVDFIEIWQPMNVNESDEVVNTNGDNKGRSIVLEVDNDEYEGLIVIVGKWIQGYLSNIDDGTHKGLSFIRAIEKDDKSDITFKYGIDSSKFVTTGIDDLKLNDTVSANGLKWKVVEYEE